MALSAPKADPKACGARPTRRSAGAAGAQLVVSDYYSMISLTTPEPTVRPPSRMAKRRPWSMAIG